MCECKLKANETEVLKAMRSINNPGCFSDEYKDPNATGGDLYGILVTSKGIKYIDMDGQEWNRFDAGSTAGL